MDGEVEAVAAFQYVIARAAAQTIVAAASAQFVVGCVADQDIGGGGTDRIFDDDAKGDRQAVAAIVEIDRIDLRGGCFDESALASAAVQ